jgi:SAM-dependent methyltransferase
MTTPNPRPSRKPSPSNAQLDAVYAGIERYYTAKIAKHGPTPFGVDWESVPAQQLRFVQLLKVCDLSRPLSLNDIGCGWGALLGFLEQRAAAKVDYVGVDLSPVMIAQARRLWAGHPHSSFAVGSASTREADYCVASGIFNVKLSQPTELWTAFVEAALDDMRANSRRGFAINFLAPLEPGAPGTPELYRPAPGIWREYCERRLGASVEVLASYGMREYTLLARLG